MIIMIDEQEIEDRITKLIEKNVERPTMIWMNTIIIDVIDIAQEQYQKGYKQGQEDEQLEQSVSTPDYE